VPRLTIVIPCLGGAAEFDGALVSVLQNRPADCEVIVAHVEAYDDPYQLRDEVTFIHASHGTPIDLLNAALDQASGEIIHFLGCGLQTTDGWTAPALAHFDDPQVAAVAPVVLAVDRETVLSAGVRWSLGGARSIVSDQRVTSPGNGRLRAKILGPTLAAAFYRRDVLQALEGFNPAIGIDLADVSVALAFESLGKLHVSEPASQLIRPTGHHAPQAGEFGRSRDAERLFWRHRSRYSAPLATALHPVTCALDTIRAKAPLFSILGRIKALTEFGSVQNHQQRLAEASTRLAELETLRSKSRKTRPAAKIDSTTTRRRAA
jgi:hypothetical protein